MQCQFGQVTLEHMHEYKNAQLWRSTYIIEILIGWTGKYKTYIKLL